MKLFKMFGRGDEDDLEDDLIDLEPLEEDIDLDDDDIVEEEVGVPVAEALDDGDKESEPEAALLLDDDQESLSLLTDDEVLQVEEEDSDDISVEEEDAAGLKVQQVTVQSEEGEVQATQVDDIMDLFAEEVEEELMPEFVLSQLVDIQASDLLTELSQVRDRLVHKN